MTAQAPQAKAENPALGDFWGCAVALGELHDAGKPIPRYTGDDRCGFCGADTEAGCELCTKEPL